MTDRIVRIGGACAFYGDSSVAAPQLIEAGVDYLILDYLAEATMSALGLMKKHRDTLGYATDFTDWVWKDNLRSLKDKGVRIVTNAGGINPRACVARMEEIAAVAGVRLRIALVEGDDLVDRLDELAAGNATEMFTGLPFPARDTVLTANAYLGGTGIARALAMGADVVITGRVVDSALTLGILMHEFGWAPGDLDRLAQGSLAGHVIECGAQATGGLFTDWEQVPDWAHIGYPIIECAADGSFVVTKPEGSGGIVTPAVVAEQILYEVGDPAAYMLPDVVCDFGDVTVESVGENRVRVAGARGSGPTGRYKVTVTHTDGLRCIAFMPVVGRDAARKAERQAQAIVTRVEEMLRARNIGPFRSVRIETLGAEASYGANASAGARATREVVYRIGVEHEDPRAFELFLREFDSPTTSMAVGTTGWFGARPQVTPVQRVFSTTIDREAVGQRVTLGDASDVVATPAPALPWTPAAPRRPGERAPMPTGATRTVPLIELAWARSGDKGDAFNIGVIARRPEHLPYIRAQLSEERLLDYFAHEFEGARNPKVTCFEVPGMNALNFLFSEALGGGQFASLRLDPLAKGKAQQLLDFPVVVPVELAAA
jgi:hypothetical protein